MPMVGLWNYGMNGYMLIAVEYVVDKAVDNGGFADGLVSEEHYLVLEQRRDRALRQVQVARVRHLVFFKNRIFVL